MTSLKRMSGSNTKRRRVLSSQKTRKVAACVTAALSLGGLSLAAAEPAQAAIPGAVAPGWYGSPPYTLSGCYPSPKSLYLADVYANICIVTTGIGTTQAVVVVQGSNTTTEQFGVESFYS